MIKNWESGHESYAMIEFFFLAASCLSVTPAIKNKGNYHRGVVIDNNYSLQNKRWSIRTNEVNKKQIMN